MLLKSQKPIIGPSREPPAWTVFLLIAGLLWITFGRGFRPVFELLRFQRDKDVSMAQSGVSDSPVTHPLDDLLGFGKEVRSVARHIMDPATSLPVCLTVEGDWGTGKTSYMRLLQAQLQEKGCQTVWINPWHHQAEENLLAAVLEGVRRGGAPTAWSLAGVRYRLRLLLARQGWFWVAGLGLGAWGAWSPETLAGAAASKLGVSKDSATQKLIGIAPWLALMGLSVERLHSVWNFLRANIASALVEGGVPAKDLANRLSLRHRVAEDLNDALQALRPGRLAVFLDDLDRCGSKELLTCFEACNFLASSGPLVLILGMSRARVEAILQAEFASTASALGEDSKAYCRAFLKKIVQQPIDVRPHTAPNLERVIAAVPSLLHEEDELNEIKDARGLLAVAAVWRVVRRAPWYFRVRDGVKMFASLLRQSLVIAVVMFGLWFIWPGFQVVAPTAHSLSPPLSYWWSLIVVLIVGAVTRLALRAIFPPTDYFDGDAYKETAREWAKVIFCATSSLRAVKRFVGRARLYASLQPRPLSESWIRNAVGYSALEELFPGRQLERKSDWFEGSTDLQSAATRSSLQRVMGEAWIPIDPRKFDESGASEATQATTAPRADDNSPQNGD